MNREEAWAKYLQEGGKPEHKEAFFSGWFFAKQRPIFDDDEREIND